MKTIIDIYTAAKILGVSQKTAINYARDGYFRAWKSSPEATSKIMCYKEDVEDYLRKLQASGL